MLSRAVSFISGSASPRSRNSRASRDRAAVCNSKVPCFGFLPWLALVPEGHLRGVWAPHGLAVFSSVSVGEEATPPPNCPSKCRCVQVRRARFKFQLTTHRQHAVPNPYRCPTPYNVYSILYRKFLGSRLNPPSARSLYHFLLCHSPHLQQRGLSFHSPPSLGPHIL